MKVWVMQGVYESEIFSSVHLTQKGCALACISDVIDFHGIESDEEALRVMNNVYSYPETKSEHTEPYHWNHEILKEMSSEQLWKVFSDWTETCWEQMSDRSYYIDATPQMVQA